MALPDITVLDSSQTEGTMKSAFFEPILDSAIDRDTGSTISAGIGYGNTNSAASNPPTPLEGQMQDLTMTSATELALMTVKGFVSLRVTGAYALTFASGWEVTGEYDNTIAEANVDLKFDGTTCWAWITNASA